MYVCYVWGKKKSGEFVRNGEQKKNISNEGI